MVEKGQKNKNRRESHKSIELTLKKGVEIVYIIDYKINSLIRKHLF